MSRSMILWLHGALRSDFALFATIPALLAACLGPFQEPPNPSFRDDEGYGTDDVSEPQVCLEEGYSWLGGDCDDADAFRNPGMTEDCEEVDANCDGDPYDGALDVSAWFADARGLGRSDRPFSDADFRGRSGGHHNDGLG